MLQSNPQSLSPKSINCFSHKTCSAYQGFSDTKEGGLYPLVKEVMKQNRSSSEEKGDYHPSATEASAPLYQQSAPHYYGTFQANPDYPQPTPPTLYPSQQYAYTTVQGYPVAEGTSVDIEYQRLPCCGIGFGWFLFLIGWFLATMPWFVGAFLLLCTRYDQRERIGLVCCTIGAFVSVIAIIASGSRERY
eukprot:c19154_g1_i3 orf=368-937(-)